MSKTPRTDEHLRVKEENGHTVIVSREFAEQLETELADKDRQLAEARAEIEQLRARNAILDNAIAEMIEEQASLCVEEQSITELVAAKDALIEQMRDALKLALPEARSTHCEQTILAALAAERTEK